MSFEKYTIGATDTEHALYPVTSKDGYACANSSISRGICWAPDSVNECFDRFPTIAETAFYLGFLGNTGEYSWYDKGSRRGQCGSGLTFYYNMWTGLTPPSSSLMDTFQPVDMFFASSNPECTKVAASSDLGTGWLGCLWGTPDAAYSCTCPEVGKFYEAYLKLRLNVATFWNTPKNTPVKRAEFLDAIKFGRKINVTVAGDFKLKLGQVIMLNVAGISGFPYTKTKPSLNGLYYITGIKHVVGRDTHETALELTQIPAIKTPQQAGNTYLANYP